MESMGFPQSPESNPEKDHADSQPAPQEEKVSTPLEQGPQFKEAWANIAISLGYEARESEGPWQVLEKDGQTIKLRHTFFPDTGDTVYNLAVGYKDCPLIKESNLMFYHRDELTDKKVQKTFEGQLKLYEKRYDAHMNRFTEEKAFNEKLLDTAETHGFAAVKNNKVRFILENDDYTIKLMHLLYKESDIEKVMSVEIFKKGQEGSTMSAIHWNEEHIDEGLNELYATIGGK